MANPLRGLPDRVGPGGAGTTDRPTRTARTEVQTYLHSGAVDGPSERAKRAYRPRPACLERPDTLLDGTHGTVSAAHQHTRARSQLLIDPHISVIDRFRRCDQGVLGEEIQTATHPSWNHRIRDEITHLTRDANGKLVDGQGRDVVDPAAPLEHGFPGRGRVQPKRGDRPHSGDDDPPTTRTRLIRCHDPCPPRHVVPDSPSSGSHPRPPIRRAACPRGRPRR